jgi:outer membrane protein
MRRRTRIALTLIGLLSFGPASAEDLLEVYDLAVESDPVLREAEQSLFATREVKPQARALLLPQLGVVGEADYQNDSVRSVSSLTGTSTSRNDTYDSQAARAVLSQSVYDRARWIGLEQADDTIARAEAQFRDAEIELMVRTTEAYFDVLRAADLVRVNESLVRANERQLEQSRQRFEVGLVAITDVNESQAAYDRSRADLISAENLLDNAWEALRRIVGPISVPLARLGEKLPLAPPEPNDIDEWAATAVQNNYAVIAALESVEVARKQIEIERSGHYPTLSLDAGYDMARSGADFGVDRDTAFVGLTLNIPIYQGGAVTSRTRQAGYDLGAAQDRLDQARRQVIEGAKNAFRGVLSSISDVQARQAAIVSARSALESTQAGLEVGTRTQVDVLNAQRNLFQAEFEYFSARYQYIINGVRLHQATSTLSREVLAKGNGWLDPDDLVSPPSN